jgi:hypothetical protein
MFPRLFPNNASDPKTKSVDGLATDAVWTTDVWFRSALENRYLVGSRCS